MHEQMFLPIGIDEIGKNQDKSINETSVLSISTDSSIQSISFKSDLIYRFFSIYRMTNRYRFLSIDYSGRNINFKQFQTGKLLMKEKFK